MSVVVVVVVVVVTKFLWMFVKLFMACLGSDREDVVAVHMYCWVSLFMSLNISDGCNLYSSGRSAWLVDRLSDSS